MYFPELSDSEDDEDAKDDDDDDASYSACEPKPKPKENGAYEMQVNWLLPFAREQRFLFRSLFPLLCVCVCARDEFVFVFVHLFLQLFTHFCQFLCIYSICIHITCARVFICSGTTCSYAADATNSVDCVRFFLYIFFFGKKIEFLWYDNVESEYIIMKSVENDSKVNVPLHHAVSSSSTSSPCSLDITFQPVQSRGGMWVCMCVAFAQTWRAHFVALKRIRVRVDVTWI